MSISSRARAWTIAIAKGIAVTAACAALQVALVSPAARARSGGPGSTGPAGWRLEPAQAASRCAGTRLQRTPAGRLQEAASVQRLGTISGLPEGPCGREGLHQGVPWSAADAFLKRGG